MEGQLDKGSEPFSVREKTFWDVAESRMVRGVIVITVYEPLCLFICTDFREVYSSTNT